MNANEPESANNIPIEGGVKATDRKAWVRPELTRLRAGAAEATPGASIFDGVQEAIGS